MPTVTRSVLVPATQQETWEALTDPDRLEDWLADDVERDGEDELTFRWDDGKERRSVIETADEPHRLSFTWTDADGDESRVAFSLTEVPAGTLVTVVETALTPVADWAPRLNALACAAGAVLA